MHQLAANKNASAETHVHQLHHLGGFFFALSLSLAPPPLFDPAPPCHAFWKAPTVGYSLGHRTSKASAYYPSDDDDLLSPDLARDTGRGITGGGSGYAALLAHAGGVLYGTELGSVTLKRIGFFCFQLNTQHTHQESCFYFVFQLNPQHTPISQVCTL